MKKGYQMSCHIAQTLNIVGDRWTLLIVRDMLRGKTMFNELKQSLQGISANVLSGRLRSLEENGIVSHSLYSKHPPRYEYKLTEAGEQLRMIIDTIALWGENNLVSAYSNMTHTACGHHVTVAYHCAHCGENVTDPELSRYILAAESL